MGVNNKSSLENTLLEVKDLLARLLERFELVNLDQLRLARQRAEQSLGDKDSPKRRIYELLDGKTGVTEIAKMLGMSQPNVSLHLKDLMDCGLASVQSEKGRRIYRKRWEE
jgi:DNA-binding transcriptional ArsR family regulator